MRVDGQSANAAYIAKYHAREKKKKRPPSGNGKRFTVTTANYVTTTPCHHNTERERRAPSKRLITFPVYHPFVRFASRLQRRM